MLHTDRERAVFGSRIRTKDGREPSRASASRLRRHVGLGARANGPARNCVGVSRRRSRERTGRVHRPPRSCVVRRRRPSARRFLMKSRTTRAASGSRPAVGSSRKITLGSCSKAPRQSPVSDACRPLLWPHTPTGQVSADDVDWEEVRRGDHTSPQKTAVSDAQALGVEYDPASAVRGLRRIAEWHCCSRPGDSPPPPRSHAWGQ